MVLLLVLSGAIGGILADPAISGLLHFPDWKYNDMWVFIVPPVALVQWMALSWITRAVTRLAWFRSVDACLSGLTLFLLVQWVRYNLSLDVLLERGGISARFPWYGLDLASWIVLAAALARRIRIETGISSSKALWKATLCTGGFLLISTACIGVLLYCGVFDGK
jgi:hypothetical protein